MQVPMALPRAPRVSDLDASAGQGPRLDGAQLLDQARACGRATFYPGVDRVAHGTRRALFASLSGWRRVKEIMPARLTCSAMLWA